MKEIDRFISLLGSAANEFIYIVVLHMSIFFVLFSNVIFQVDNFARENYQRKLMFAFCAICI